MVDAQIGSHRGPRGLCIRVATDEDRREIYRCRHDVYAVELGQHERHELGALRDGLDDSNVYLAALRGGRLAGFISVTPPDAGRYSIEKYVAREEWPVDAHSGLFEIRLLTVLPEHRRGLRRSKAGSQKVLSLRAASLSGQWDAIRRNQPPAAA